MDTLSYQELQALAKCLNQTLELDPTIHYVGITKEDLLSSIEQVIVDNKDNVLLEELPSIGIGQDCVDFVKTTITDATSAAVTQPLDETDEEPQEESEDGINEPQEESEAVVEEQKPQAVKSTTPDKPKRDPLAVRIASMLDQYTRRRVGEGAWSVDRRIKKFTDVMIFALDHPTEEVLDELTKFLVSFKGNIVSDTLFHNHINTAVTSGRRRQKMSVFFTSMITLAKSRTRGRRFPLDPKRLMSAIRDQRIVDYIVAKAPR